MEKGKTGPPEQTIRAGKYLKYAIGEIVLVVIGILIALQINNSNNYYKERQVEQEYLLSLKTEFEANLDKLLVSIEENEECGQTLENLLTLFDKDVLDTVSDKSIASMFLTVMGGVLSYEPSIGVLKDIISSGRLNIILNKKLRQNLASFESSLEFFKLQEAAANKAQTNLYEFLYRNGSFRNFQLDLGWEFEHKSISEKIDNRLIFDSVEFENYLVEYFMLSRATSGSRLFGGIKEQIESILLEIENEINN